jgi:murein DD-endopeptidase MepM/ murein hydrolase activator NlpD
VRANPAVPVSYEYPHDGVGRDHDSVGLFQQRPHWGDIADLMNPAASAGLFYDALERVEGWEAMPVTVAAQRVQVSAHPDAYARHEAPATAAADLIAAGLDCSGARVHPLPGAPLTSGWRTEARPSHTGVDLGAVHGTPILAASAGQVVTAVCNAFTADGRAFSCDVDGSPSMRGCGWYVEIAHAEGLLTRYCHMVQRPEVAVGDQVAAGEVLGFVGSSGRSSGPHLHLEVHRSHRPAFETALSPQVFFSGKGIDL